MGHLELIESLRREGSERLAALREGAEIEASRLEAETAARIGALHELYAGRRRAAVAAKEEAVLSEARRRESLIGLEADNLLASRLYRLARGALPKLGREGGAGLFEALAAELFNCRWETVRVNPADEELARLAFPDARIEGDDSLSGGLEASAEGGRVRVDNTLEKRLERAWPELLPVMLDAVEREP